MLDKTTIPCLCPVAFHVTIWLFINLIWWTNKPCICWSNSWINSGQPKPSHLIYLTSSLYIYITCWHKNVAFCGFVAFAHAQTTSLVFLFKWLHVICPSKSKSAWQTNLPKSFLLLDSSSLYLVDKLNKGLPCVLDTLCQCYNANPIPKNTWTPDSVREMVSFFFCLLFAILIRIAQTISGLSSFIILFQRSLFLLSSSFPSRVLYQTTR